MKRRFTKADIKFISLCPRGVNRLPVIYKAEGKGGTGALDLDLLVKADDRFDDNGELTAIVYAPEFRDSEGDIASAAVIKEAMYNAAKNGVQIDLRHNEKALPKGSAFIAETFIVQKGDPRFLDMKDYAGNKVDVTGAWGTVIKIEDAVLRKAYRNGEWNGVSMGGTAAVEMEKSDDVLAKLSELLRNPQKKDIDMDKKELVEVLAENNKSLVGSITEGIAKALKPAEKPPENKPAENSALVAPVFKGDIGNPADVKKHQLAMKKYNLAKAVDWNNEASVDTYLAELAKLDGNQPAPVEKSDEVKRLEAELADAQKRSNQPVGKEQCEGDNKGKATILKDEDLFKMGATMAKSMNERRGMAVVK